MNPTSSDYEYEIFISYRRSDNNWVRWTREIFVVTLQSLLRLRLGSIKLYVDESIDAGKAWPQHIARGLARSKIMVPILSRDYFTSEWCRLELALMHHRETSLNVRSGSDSNCLILPVIIDDGNCFPAEIQAMQNHPLHDFANPFIVAGTVKQAELAEALRGLCVSIEHALATVPPFDTAWESFAVEHFLDKFHIQVQTQTTVPAFTLPRL